MRQAVGDWADDPLEAARGLSARALVDHRLEEALIALTEYFDVPRLFAK